jgi:hypothetical protein
MIELLIWQYPISLGLSSLAMGADQFYVECLKKNSIPYLVIIPSIDYEKTFQSEQDLASYENLLRAAAESIRLPFDQPGEPAYYAAGKEIVDRSDLMIALWNGLPARGLGGTGDIVNYTLEQHKRLIHLNPLTSTMKIL